MNRRAPALLILLPLLLAGCNDKFGGVKGKVTLDGQPLVGATVEFNPEGGSPAYGVTNEAGEYELLWSPEQSGAPIGKNKVRITSFSEAQPRIKERVPLKYNRQSELIRDVGPGKQVFDFDLSTR